MTQLARFVQRDAALHTEFALAYVEQHFGAAVTLAVYNALPKFHRGPHRGLVKGHVHWRRCFEGGWYRDPKHYGRGYVVYPGVSGICLRVGSDPLSIQIIYAGQQPENTTDEVAAAFAVRAVAEAFR